MFFGAESVGFNRLRPWTWWIRLDLHGEYCDVTITSMPSARPFVANDFPVLQLSQDGGGGDQCKTAGRFWGFVGNVEGLRWN